jgi:hypothetical protein
MCSVINKWRSFNDCKPPVSVYDYRQMLINQSMLIVRRQAGYGKSMYVHPIYLRVAYLVVKLAESPELEVRRSLGVNKPNTEGDRPAF